MGTRHHHRTARLGCALSALLAAAGGLPLAIGLMATAASPPPAPAAGGLATEGLSSVAADAYQRASERVRHIDPDCRVPAWILAGVGEIESGHGTYGGAAPDARGDVRPKIIGIPLPKLGGDSDNGEWDDSTSVDHAVGPMQFIPSSWRAYGQDGNSDGNADPHNVYDATLAAAVLLCDVAGPMETEAQWRRGLFAYNHSTAYVNEVLEAAHRHRAQPTTPAVAVAAPGGPVELVDIPRIGPTNIAWAHQVRALLAAADADGLTLSGGSYRNPEQQIALRRAHCGASHYAIYEMPASSCSPPTARPGRSNHERGLAIDFTNCSTRATACHRWLAANAHRFGLINLPSEPWHWSIDGR